MDSTKKAVIFIIVGLLILSLILFYFPFTLSRPALEQKQTEQPLDGFSGLEDESKSLEELKNLLEEY